MDAPEGREGVYEAKEQGKVKKHVAVMERQVIKADRV